MLSERVERCIRFVRGQKVPLDSDLAAIYGVETRELNQAVKRNIERLPEDLMFQLDDSELDSLRSQAVISRAAARRLAHGAMSRALRGQSIGS